MSGNQITISIDGIEVEAKPGQSIIQAADDAGIYIPRLCYREDLEQAGHCRVCTVNVNGKPTNACNMPVQNGMVIENDTPELTRMRQEIIEMLFVEGNHFCPFCEKAGNCELQALAYRFGITAPMYPYLYPKIEVDATHPDVYIDRNRCVLCGRCVRASRDLDGKHVFGFEGRGINMKIAVNAEHSLSETQLEAADKAADICPTGSIVVKRKGYSMPYGTRLYDKEPIGSDIEKKANKP
ncbi:MAG: (2Fe-2S)-binding protein [Spirochaetes bacterium]|nr:(2Fe-2S)-binding protein [Spirochaetota bacterium]